MNVIIESNIDCSFMQKIIKLPQFKEELIHANINIDIINTLLDYEKKVSELKRELKKYNHLISFIDNCLLNQQIYYVKTFSDDLEDLSEDKEYICLGEYHRNSKGINLFIRIDQNWADFDFSFFYKITDSIKFLKLLSGTTVDLLLPELIKSQDCLIDNSLASEHLDMSIEDFNKFKLIATRYFGKKYFINADGDIYHMNMNEQTILKSNQNFAQWLDNELNNIFEPKTKDNE